MQRTYNNQAILGGKKKNKDGEFKLLTSRQRIIKIRLKGQNIESRNIPTHTYI